MKVRNIVDGNVVWFGSQGANLYLNTDFLNTYKTLATDISAGETVRVKTLFRVPHFNVDDVYQLQISFQATATAGVNKTIVVTLDKNASYVQIDDNTYEVSVLVELLNNVDIHYVRFTRLSTIEFEYASVIRAISGKQADSFVYQQEGVAADLTQRLSVLKNELWYQINYGLPLLDKIKSKAVIDASVLDIITSHPNVVRVSKFESQVLNRKYSCKATIVSEFGPVQLNL